MEVRTKLRPVENGTKALVGEYRDQLVYVRYRYDEEKPKRYKTVEIIVEECSWTPTVKPPRAVREITDRLGIKVAPFEIELRTQVKPACRFWRPRQKLWELPYGQITALGLEGRIVTDRHRQD